MKLFIGHFGDKNKNDWFFSWAKDEKDAINIIENMFGKPEYIKEITNVSPGGLCFKPVDVSNDTKPYYLIETLPDDFKFENDDIIQKIILKEKNIKDIDLNREKYRKMINEKNKKQQELEEIEYTDIIKKIDSF
jgi:hypothetical protein